MWSQCASSPTACTGGSPSPSSLLVGGGIWRACGAFSHLRLHLPTDREGEGGACCCGSCAGAGRVPLPRRGVQVYGSLHRRGSSAPVLSGQSFALSSFADRVPSHGTRTYSFSFRRQKKGDDQADDQAGRESSESALSDEIVEVPDVSSDRRRCRERSLDPVNKRSGEDGLRLPAVRKRQVPIIQTVQV